MESFSLFFEDCGYRVIGAVNGQAGLASFQKHRPDLIFTDLLMPQMDGLEFMRRVKELSPETPVVFISGINVVADAIKAVQAGAWDFITKPVLNLTELELIAKRALETVELRHEVSALRQQVLDGHLQNKEVFAAIVTQDESMLRIFRYIEAIAPTSQPVLIAGPTGTGKELLAQSVHTASRRTGKLVAVNLGGLDDQIFSDTLFGHLKGAFTGADRVREGVIAQAAGGTLFLDEIGELTESSQIKLLRLLQEQEYYPLGSDRPSKTTARIIAATNRDLHALVDEGRFRQDLFYRLCTHQVNVPPLQARKGDIPLLLELFVTEAAIALHKDVPAISSGLPSYLATYNFPGNVRELKALVYDAVARHSRGLLAKEYFIQAMDGRRPHNSATPAFEISPQIPGDRLPTLKEAEASLIRQALELANGNQGVAARHLGITRQGLNKILNRKKRLSES
ncbi:sigma-54-dependent transcriptional regulator [Pelotalea chapellei]|uniref:sigma-54-dependent transcriptional regulator n=1 Tax=Pelotalea chapellei TaxID=44671 RepID=UPI001FE6E1D9|nr:sigma-54 dependent transcriptional regulator [Pelotalea chapellei]